MRTYDDSFSGQKIYPGKVRLQFQSSPLGGICVRGNNGIADSTFTLRYFNTVTIVALRLSRTAAHKFRRVFIATRS
jgi:hypothetical protein